TTVSVTNVTLQAGGLPGTLVPAKVSLDATGTVILLQPVDGSGNPVNLLPNTYYYVVGTGITSVGGVAQPVASYWSYFLTGTATDTVVPTVKSVTPANGTINVGDNARIVVRFS